MGYRCLRATHGIMPKLFAEPRIFVTLLPDGTAYPTPVRPFQCMEKSSS